MLLRIEAQVDLIGFLEIVENVSARTSPEKSNFPDQEKRRRRENN
jgi:hypothetical protein